MNKKRPINLDLTTLKFPVMAISSILHRISGVVLFLLLPFMLYLLSLSLRSPLSFNDLLIQMQSPLYKLGIWAFLTALVYHLLAGVRHLFMDIGIGETLKSGRQSAIFVISASVILTFIVGMWIW